MQKRATDYSQGKLSLPFCYDLSPGSSVFSESSGNPRRLGHTRIRIPLHGARAVAVGFAYVYGADGAFGYVSLPSLVLRLRVKLQRDRIWPDGVW